MIIPPDAVELGYHIFFDEYYLIEVEGFAKAAHRKQAYGDQPYWRHLRRVVELCKEYMPGGMPDWALLGAAWLHDVAEDTGVTIDEIEYLYGENVAGLVQAVTDAPGKNRKERKAGTYKKIVAHGPRALMLKLADRIANVESSKANNPSLFNMYRKEHADMKAALKLPELATKMTDLMWDRLDELLDIR